MEGESKELQAQREKKKASTKTKFKALEKKVGDNEHLVRFTLSNLGCWVLLTHAIHTIPFETPPHPTPPAIPTQTPRRTPHTELKTVKNE